LIAAEPVSAYDAKTHLPQLLERTGRGELFVITRHGARRRLTADVLAPAAPPSGTLHLNALSALA
jgi:antitoxin (DNA-binding transcriptional repressor) of toxin-antitoxin stability system